MVADLRCWYCGTREVSLTDEHVLSEANFGGRLVARDAVCGSCNRMVGRLEREITSDAFLSYLVGRHAPQYAPRRGPRPIAEGILEDGTEVRVKFTPEGPKVISRVPRMVERLEDGTEVWDVASREEEKVRRRLAKQGARVQVRGRDASDVPGLNVKWGLGPANVANWSRLGAKVALSLANLVLEPTWLDTPGALALQDVLHKRSWPTDVLPRDLPIHPGALDPNEEPACLLAPSEHVLGLDRDEDGNPRSFMMLFGGEIYFELPLPDAAVSTAECIWLVPAGSAPRGPLPGKTMLNELRAR